MAPIGEKTDREKIFAETNEEGDEKDIWESILSEVQSSSSTKLPSNKSILVLGDNESGKTTLIARLQGTEDPKKGAGLEYHYIKVKDEYRDDHTRLGVWILDGDPYHTNLLSFALSKPHFADSLVLLSVSMAQPWNIMESLRRWSEFLQDHINRLRIPAEQMKEYEQKLVKEFQEYVEPEEGAKPQTQRRAKSSSTAEEERALLPLGETTLTHNLGVPIVVVVTKTDAISTLEKEHDYREEHFDFIQQHIRKFCLNYGAALFYSSVKEDKNCDLLYKYLVHRIYDFPFTSQAYVVERDCVFVPSGWDNEKKISILYESMSTMKPDDIFEDVLTKPVTRKTVQREAEISAEDEQVFLMKQQANLNKQPAPGRQDSPLRPAAGLQKPTTSPRVGASSTAASALAAGSPKKLDASKAGPGTTNEGVLANFFNSLLSKKTGASPGGPKGTERASVSRDAAAELDRMTRSKKAVPGQTPNSNAS